MPFQNRFAVGEGLERPVHADLVLPGQMLDFDHGVGHRFYRLLFAFHDLFNNFDSFGESLITNTGFDMVLF